jgi:hypothetical protein
VEFIDLVVGSEIAISNVLERIEFLSKIGNGIFSTREIEFAASHFFELDPSRLNCVEFAILEAILSGIASEWRAKKQCMKSSRGFCLRIWIFQAFVDLLDSNICRLKKHNCFLI